MFSSSIGQHSPLRIVLALTMCVALLLMPSVYLLVSVTAQGQGGPGLARPRPGKPEGTWPDLEQVKRESKMRHEPLPPIPSALRSRKAPLQPWNGRTVGDPDARSGANQMIGEVRHAHARRRANPPPPLPDDQFVQNFFSWALLRAPNSNTNEPTYWNDQLRVAYAQGQTALKLAAIELGKTLFESAEYAARNRDNHWYVYDLYKTYLMRDPDSGGWAYWEALAPGMGRENVRRGFEESTEFATLISNMVPNGSAGANAASLISARVAPRNQPGSGMLGRDATWSVPLLALPGRAGLDLGLTLSYSSMVWTRSGPYLYFDEDNGFPSPGFRLGFPTVQRKVFDAQTTRNSYLLITAAGHRVELRQVGTSNIYDAADSSYLRLTENGGTLLVQSTDGTRLSFTEINGEYRCIEVKDRNGNYITVNYNSIGRLTNITDTLNRVITFNYDGNANLLSITQAWNGQPSHQWVSFGWSAPAMQSSFSDSSLQGIVGIKNGDPVPVITQVVLNDTSYFTFEYTNSLQVSAIRNNFGSIERNATSFTYETPAGDVPRLLDSRVSARNWTGVNGVPSQVITTYSVAGDGACVLTAPDGTVYKQYYGTGWQRGLTTLSEVWSGGVRQKWTTTSWTQDNTAVGYEVNPRVTETNVYDSSGNRRRTVIDYGPYAQYGLPYGVREFAADGVTELRQTYTDYNLSQAYVDQRLIGLVAYVHMSNVAQWQSKVSYEYDDPSRLQAVSAAATQHDVNYNTSFTARGNVTAVSRWDINDIGNAAKKLTTYTNYYTTGTPSSRTDPAGHQSTITYGDSFSVGGDRNTFAYPTTITDTDNNSSYVQYNYDFGAITRTQSPAPAGQTQGAIQTMSYNNLGQLDRTTTTNNNAYTRFWYGPDYMASYATVNNVADELYSIQVVDGMGNVIGAANNHPGSTGGYRLVVTIYDRMGRAVQQSNPGEIDNSWVPRGDDAGGLYFTQQTYDWKGRPLVTTNQDGTTKIVSYDGCGCAGGEVVTLTDEGTIDAGVPRRRQQKIYSDVFGRTVKTEILNWQGGSIYSTTVNTYNVRDQVERIRQYVGVEGSSTYQDTTMSYDGYGRLQAQHVPEQAIGSNTVWEYNVDGTVQRVTDGRGAAIAYRYNSRQLVTSVRYTAPVGSGIPAPGPVTYAYDAAGNRTSMNDDTGSTDYGYDSLSRISSETRTFTGFSGTYVLNYSYNLANALTLLSIPFRSQQIGYNYDTANRLSGVTASGFTASYYPYTQNITSFASNITYRAWDGRKSMTYGNTTSEQTTYNSRLQPASYTLSNMNYQNTNVCCTYPTYSTMSWTYDYYDDGQVKNAWDSTNNWFDRAYKYDHVGRLKESSTFRRAHSLSPYPAVNYPDPYYQSITYDAFNHASRTGLFYTGQPSDVGTWVNNRRTETGWAYDADGNTIADPKYSQTFDAAGRQSHSVSTATVGYPYQPQLDITVAYDGTGTPAKRVQISRQPGSMDEFGNQAPPIEDVQTTYFLKSSVLDATLVELTDPWSSGTVHIYANGQRIAREMSGSVVFEHHNPVTGSWVTSLGHSSYRTTNREERDPFGSEIPTSNPFAYAQSYVDMKFSEPLFVEGGDPFDYTGGCTSFGMPIACADAARYVAGGLGQVNGIAVSQSNPRTGPQTQPTSKIVDEMLIQVSYVQLIGQGPGWWRYFRDTVTKVVNVPTEAQAQQNTGRQIVPLGNLQKGLEELLKGDCGVFVQKLIDKAYSLYGEGKAHATSFWDAFSRIQDAGGYQFDDVAQNGATVSGELFVGELVNPSLPEDPQAGPGTVHMKPFGLIGRSARPAEAGLNQVRYVYKALHETLHLAKRGWYSDEQLARAAHEVDQTTPPKYKKDDILSWSGNFDRVLQRHCAYPFK